MACAPRSPPGDCGFAPRNPNGTRTQSAPSWCRRSSGADVIDAAFRRYNLALGAGLSKVSGKLFRIGHLGDLNDLMVLGALAGAEMAMRDVGIVLPRKWRCGSAGTLPQDHHGERKKTHRTGTLRTDTSRRRCQRLKAGERDLRLFCRRQGQKTLADHGLSPADNERRDP